ncbi:multidrug efflux system membrane fusion protein [Acinetobacter calcoaceticus]|uniref:Multidrug efflux system membrane fusion protein n=1 Tax=Acinetobacter calcoaceticus TaxID=471 RepID=A0A4R1XUU9_ACICA|nr:multidrug efflux system membrane fusion protein [Acinetobacter calcoaceticus]
MREVDTVDVAKPHAKKQRTKMIWILMFLLLVGGALGAWKYWKTKLVPEESYSQWSKPVPVRVVAVEKSDLLQQVKAIGTVMPSQLVQVQSQVSGVLQQLYFKDGQMVKKGQLLAQIDPASYQVAVAQALGTQQQNLAQLANAETELRRYELLFQRDSIAKQQLEQQQAMVKQLRGQIQANQALVDAAKLQLSYSKIYAPISGRVGFRQKDVGNLIQANDATPLLSITQVSPIYVQFSIPEQELGALRAGLKQGQALQVSSWDRHDQQQLAVGQIHAIDNQIDLTTGSVKLKAIYPNLDDRLFPNQFVNVRLNLNTIANALTVPSDAIQHGAKGAYVYIIDAESKAQLRVLKLGLSSQGRTQVLAGLTGQEKVVLEGIDRLSEGKAAQIVTTPATATTTTTATPTTTATSVHASSSVTAVS